MTDLAEAEDGNFIPLKTLSHRRNLSVKYLEQILIQMGKAGLVTGSRGTNGGYRLSRDSNTYTVGEILRAMEGELSVREKPKSHHLESPGNEKFWNEFTEKVNEFADSYTLKDLARQNAEFAGYEYCI
jgi:Rrf2 family protein